MNDKNHDHKKVKTTQLSGDFDLLYVQKLLYLKVKNLFLQDKEQSPNIILINLLLQNYKNKWIMLDDPHTFDIKTVDNAFFFSLFARLEKAKDFLKKNQLFVSQ
ncbi:MAG: hypothetical protein GXP45_03955 [bacterium]|nr:hypothetical protein [bacterium]